MEYIRKKFTLGRDNKIELRIDTPLELQGNNWYCGLREFSLEQKWSLSNEEITIYYQNGHYSIVKPGFYHSVADLDNILDELFLPMRRIKRQGGRAALDRMSGIRNRYQQEEDSEEEAEEEETPKAETETPAANVETKAETEPNAKKQKIDPETFETIKIKEGQGILHWIPKTGHFPNIPAKDYPKPITIKKVGESAEVAEGLIDRKPVPKAESLVDDNVFERKKIPTVVDVDFLKDADKILAERKAKNKEAEKNKETKTEEERKEKKKEAIKVAEKTLEKLKPVEVPSKNPIPTVPKVPEFTPKKPRPVEEAKKEEPKPEVKVESEPVPVKTEDKEPELREGEKIEPVPVNSEPQEEKNTSFFPAIKQEIIQEEQKISPEILEFNQKGYNSVRIEKNISNYYSVTFDPNYVREVHLSDGFAKALGFTKNIITHGDIASHYPSMETNISHICMSINDILRPLNDEETAEIGVIPINDQSKVVHKYFANPLWFKLENTRINLLSVEFTDYSGNPIACDNAHGHFALVFANQKR